MRTMTMLVTNSNNDDYDNCDNDTTMSGLPLYVWAPLEKCASPSSPSTRLELAFTISVFYQMDLSHVVLFIMIGQKRNH